MRPRDSIFIAGYFGFDNAGDEAILGCMLDHLRCLRPDLDFTVASGNPEKTAARHGVRAVLWNNIHAVRAAVEQCSLVLVGGGGIFHDYWGVDPDGFLTDKHWGAVYFAGPAALAMLHAKPLMLYAVGVGPLFSEHARAFTRAAGGAANVITVRDAASKELLESLGVEAGKIFLTADPAFAFSPQINSAPVAAHPVLGVSLRAWAFGAYPEFWQREVASALDSFLDRHNGSVLFLPFQSHPGERENDVAVAERVRSLMRAPDRTCILPDSSPESLYAAIGRCDVVLGMRLHALIFAFLSRRPFVALNYDPKVDEFVKSTGMQGFSASITAVDARLLSGMINRAMAEASHFAAPLDGLRQELARMSRENACAAIRLLENPVPAHMEPAGASLLARSLKVHQVENSGLKSELAITTNQRDMAAHDRETARAELQNARQLIADTALGLASYRARMDSELKAYRSQRAWTVMLAIRKAYTLLTRDGKLAFAKWLLSVPFSGLGPLTPYELPFPDVAASVPPALLHERSTRAAIPRQHKYDVIILAIIDFDFRFQRPQQIAAQFARDGHRVFWISPTRFLPPLSPAPYHLVPLRENLWEVHLRGQQPEIYLGELNPELIASMGAALHQLMRDWAVSESVAFIQLPFWRQVGLRLRQDCGSMVLYDCMDEWSSFPNMGRFNVSEERRLVHEANILAVSGRILLEKFQAEGLHPVLARNGVDLDFYNQAHPHVAVQAPQPVIGYFGAIADWIDLELIRSAALARPQYSFVMIGQVFRDDIAKIELPNVYLLGSKPYGEIPSYLEHFDVCVIPFLLNEVTKATDPVKLYEYLTSGKPVVATAMAELAECGDLIYIADGPADYASKLDLAVADSNATLRERRIAYAAANTWQERCRTLDSAIRGIYPLVSIVVVTHNGVEFVLPCLESIAAETSYPNYEVVVVDNASTDGTQQAVRDHIASHGSVTLHELTTNIGFAGANNAGAKIAKGEYLVLLNSDTIVTSGWLGRLVRHLQLHTDLGLLCPVTNFAGNEAMIEIAYVSAEEMQDFAQERARANAGRLFQIEVAPLFCAILGRKLWSELGGLDERFQVGMFEDDDFSCQVRRRGLRVAAAEDCFVHHFGQGSFAKLPRETYEEVFRNNRRRFEEKWKTAWKPHQTRPGVKPAFERTRFLPATFCDRHHQNEPSRHVHPRTN